MKKRILSVLLVLSVVFLCLPGTPVNYAAAAAGDTSIDGLKVNFQTEPLVVDTSESVRFSWKMESNEIGMGQSAYRIRVHRGSGTGGALVWDSGNVRSSISTGILYGGPVLSKEALYTWTVDVVGTDGNVYSASSFFETECDFAGADWIIPPGQASGSAFVRTERTLGGDLANVSSARLYITALGIYTVHINGEKVMMLDNGQEIDDIFNPGWTDYRSFVNYQAYDITDYLADSFALGVMLGKGFYAGRISGTATYGAVIGPSDSARELAMLAKVVITYDDGTPADVFFTSDDGRWKSSGLTPVTANDFYDGEDYDANIAAAVRGWDNLGYDVTSWDNVIKATYGGRVRPSTQAVARIAYEYTKQPVEAYTYSDSETVMPPTSPWALGHVVRRSVDFDAPISLAADDKLIVNLGQNITGVAEITVSGPQGAVVRMRHTEMLNDGRKYPELPDTFGSDGPRGTLYLTALRSARATDRYTLSDDSVQTYRPVFTHHGFQYLELSADADITVHGIKGLSFTAVGDQLGFVETSDEDVNQLFSNVLWGQKGNNLSVPTDNTQRDERHGWTGDAQVFTQSAVFNYDVYSFNENYIEILNAHAATAEIYANPMMAMLGMGAANSYGSIVPAYNDLTSYLTASGWSDAGIIIPWVLYRQTGDKATIERHWDQMNAYLDHVGLQRNPLCQTAYNSGYYGDWLAFGPAHTTFLNVVFHIHITMLMAEMAEAIGDTAAKEKYEGNLPGLRAHFFENFVDAQSNVLSQIDPDALSMRGNFPFVDNAQTALLWTLKLGLYRSEAEKNIMLGNLAKSIRNEGRLINEHTNEDTLAVGFLGVNVLLPVLTEMGAHETAYTLLLQDALPSWLATVKAGATTIWERWDSYSIERGIGDSTMNSLNHYAYGACAEWMFEYMAGISPGASAGFKDFTLQPTVDVSGRISWVNGSYDSLYGKTASNWKASGGRLTGYEAIVPANTAATLYLPVNSVSTVELPEYGVEFLGTSTRNGLNVAVFELLSGGYEFGISSSGEITVSLVAGYVQNAAMIGISIEERTAIGGFAEFVISADNLTATNLIVIDYEVEGSSLMIGADVVGQNGFTRLPVGTGPELVGPNMWRGQIYLAYEPLETATFDSVEVARLRLRADSLGDVNVTLTSVSAYGLAELDDPGNPILAGERPAAIKPSEGSGSTRITYIADVNGDLRVDNEDLAEAIYYYRVGAGSALWEAAKRADVNRDGIIDLIDIVMIYYNFTV